MSGKNSFKFSITKRIITGFMKVNSVGKIFFAKKVVLKILGNIPGSSNFNALTPNKTLLQTFTEIIMLYKT